MSNDRPRGAFATTRWATVNAAGQTSDAQSASALAELCEIYWPPLYGYLRARGYQAEEAQDLTQGFFTRLLQTHSIRSADPARGRFRSFLLTALKRYVINEHERSVAARRGGRHIHLTLNFDEAEGSHTREPRTDDTPERLFDRKWAIITLERALQRLRMEHRERGRESQVEALIPYLTGADDLPSYRALAAHLQMSEGAVKVAIHRLRQRYGTILRSEIAETVLGVEQVDAELRELLRAVSP